MKKILFVASHRLNRSPGQRFRFEQYFKFFEESGYITTFSYLLDEKDDTILYRQGNRYAKFNILRSCYQKRKSEAATLDQYDIIFIQREALLTRSIYFEKKAASSKAKVIFDFDDAIWLSNVSEANKYFSWLKRPSKTKTIIEIADYVIAGNRYLADYAMQFNNNVSIIPTTIDTLSYIKKCDKKVNDKICIGWSGSFSTIIHFELVVDVLQAIRKKYKDKVYFKVIGDGNYHNHNLGIQGISWNMETEIEELSEIDIGLMPLPNDKWAKGKCALKGIQYMALEIPAIMSSVGVNSKIIEQGVNGFLASGKQEWIDCISLLIENEQLRKDIGKHARQTVIDHYSVLSQQNHYLKIFDKIITNS